MQQQPGSCILHPSGSSLPGLSELCVPAKPHRVCQARALSCSHSDSLNLCERGAGWVSPFSEGASAEGTNSNFKVTVEPLTSALPCCSLALAGRPCQMELSGCLVALCLPNHDQKNSLGVNNSGCQDSGESRSQLHSFMLHHGQWDTAQGTVSPTLQSSCLSLG